MEDLMNRLQVENLEFVYPSAYGEHQQDSTYHAGNEATRWKLGPLSFTIAEGEHVGIVGDSGSGKSTLLHVMQHYDTPALSYCMPHVEIAGAVHKPHAPLMTIMQESKSVLNPIHTIQHCFRVIHKRSAAHGRVEPLTEDEIVHYLTIVGFEHTHDVLHAKPHQLSGGMAQRVMIALVLAAGAKWVLADEVSASLDMESEEKIMQTLTRHIPSLIIVTHRLHIITRFCTRIIFLDNGRILFDGSIEQFFMSSHDKIKVYIDNLQLTHGER